MNNTKMFFDTCSLLNFYDSIFKSEDRFVISEVTLRELESIKTSYNKSDEVKYKARQVTKLLAHNQNKYDVLLMVDRIFDMMEVMELQDTPDNRIIMTATYYYQSVSPIIFITDDLCLYNIAKQITPIPVKLGFEVFGNENIDDVYKGYQEVKLSDEKLAYFYEHLNENQFENLINEYLIIEDNEDKPIDAYKWTGDEYKHISARGVDSDKLGKCKPLDKYQECAFDSLKDNDITCLFGRAGAGKTTIPLAYLMAQMEKQKITKIYFVYHFEPLKNSRQLGYVKGDLITKELYSSSIGNILSSKFGDITEVERMIEDNKIEIIPTANIRGVEFNENSAVFVTEAQDIDTYTLKTIIQRCKQGCKLIVEGDVIEQSDIDRGQSGMERMIEVFKGFDKFGCIKLKNNYRSSVSELADKM